MMSVVLTLYSCIHDEMYNSSEILSSKEYSSKSLWKEDEKYIKNVKQVFDQYADKQYFSTTYGDLYWDYALSMGTFDETFLEVPIIKNGKVKEILIAERKADRVYFSRKISTESNNFFNILVFKDRDQLTGKIISNNEEGIGSKSQVCYTVEVTFTWTNVDGSAGPVYTYYETRCRSLGQATPPNLNTCLDPSGDCSPDNGNNPGGGDGGYPYPQTPQTPCEKIQGVGKATVTKNAMKNLKTQVNDNKEHIYLLWEDSIGQLHDDIYGTGPVNGGGINFNFDSGDMFSALLHSHYNRPDMLSTFSFDDFISICNLAYFNAIKDQNSFVMGVVTASGTQYMMVIDDYTKLATFANQMFINGVYNEENGNLYERFYNNSVFSANTIENNEVGLAFFLESQDIGLKLLKGDDQMENWQQFTKNNQGNIAPANCN